MLLRRSVLNRRMTSSSLKKPTPANRHCPFVLYPGARTFTDCSTQVAVVAVD